jgi:hypothetical protein
MKRKKLFPVVMILLTGIVLVAAGAFLRSQHPAGAGVILVAGLIATIVSVLELMPLGIDAQRIQPPDNFRKTLLHLSFSIGLGIAVYAFLLDLAGLPVGAVILALAGITTLVFYLIVLVEVLGSPRIRRSEKVVWTVSIILFHYLAGLVYLLRGRRHVASEFSGAAG